MPRPVFRMDTAFEQTVHQRFIGLGARVCHKGVRFQGGWREAGKVQMDPNHQIPGSGQGQWFEIVGLQSLGNDLVDGQGCGGNLGWPVWGPNKRAGRP